MLPKIAVVGNGLVASFCITLLLKDGAFQVYHYENPLSTPSSLVAAGIVHPFNFKVAGWRKYGKENFQRLLNFLQFTNSTSFFHQIGLFFATEDTLLLNDYDAISLQYPEWVQVNAQGIFFPWSGWIDVPDFLKNLYLQFEIYPHYHRVACKYETPLYKEDWILHAGGIESLSQNPHLPLFAKQGNILTIYAPMLELHPIFWKKFYVIPLGYHLFKLGPDGLDSLKQFERLFHTPFQILEQSKGLKPYATTGRAFCLQENATLHLNGVGGRGILEGLRLAHEALHFLQTVCHNIA